MINASSGFEMETFEFINILQVNGMPKVKAVLTHLDKLPKAKMKSTKRLMKHRLWTELYKVPPLPSTPYLLTPCLEV
jgi:ribosome biogenesis protein BMS1